MKFPKSKKLRYFLIATGLLIAWIYRPCYYDGCYGPFEVVIMAENGERVEDVIVNLTHVTVGFMGTGKQTYKESVIGNTGETIRFPRDFVYESDSERLLFHYGIMHPDYESHELYAYFPNKEGAIDLGEKIILNKQVVRDRKSAIEMEKYRKEGYSEEEISKKLEGKRLIAPRSRISNRYLARLLDLGRQDIFDKYWVPRAKVVIESEGWDKTDAEKWKKEKLKIIHNARR